MAKKQKTETATSTHIKGAALERRVAEVYHQLGAESVQTNLRLAGQELDVLAIVRGADGFFTRVGIDCKNYAAKVGVNEVNAAAQKLALLRQTGHIDLAVLLSGEGFTPEAANAAISLGIRTTTLGDLLRRIADFSGYLNRAVQEYEGGRIHSRGLYRPLRCTSEDDRDLGYVHEHVARWFADGGQLLTLLGDFGTGKTTFVERLFWEAANAYLKEPASHRIPIFVPLKRYRKEINLRSLITDLLLHEYGVRIPDYRTFTTLNEDGRLLIILDAFDEMATGADEAEVISNFRELVTLVTANSRVLITCRTHYFKDQDHLHRLHTGTVLYRELDETSLRYSLCFISPFLRDDIEYLVQRYAPDRADEYLSVIDTTYNLKELSTHPILLEMILTTVPAVLRSSQLLTPSDLYTTYTSFWLDRDDWRTKMTREQREFFMRELGLHFQLNGLTSIHFRNLPRYIRQHFPGLRTFRELDYFETDVRTCTFLVRDKSGHYGFVHRSFGEFFAALAAFEHLLSGEWPDHLRHGRGKTVIEWITPEVGGFFGDLVVKRNAFEHLARFFFADDLKGTLVLVILGLLRYSPRPEHKELFDVAYVLYQGKQLGGVDYRGQIADLAEAHHTEGWRTVRDHIAGSGSRGGQLRFLAFTDLHERLRAGREARRPNT